MKGNIKMILRDAIEKVEKTKDKDLRKLVEQSFDLTYEDWAEYYLNVFPEDMSRDAAIYSPVNLTLIMNIKDDFIVDNIQALIRTDIIDENNLVGTGFSMESDEDFIEIYETYKDALSSRTKTLIDILKQSQNTEEVIKNIKDYDIFFIERTIRRGTNMDSPNRKITRFHTKYKAGNFKEENGKLVFYKSNPYLSYDIELLAEEKYDVLTTGNKTMM